MGADSYGTCPKCLKKDTEERNLLNEKKEREYGKIPCDKYWELLKESRKTLPAIESQTLRIGYAAKISFKGEFAIFYDCFCEKCGFEHKFKHEEQCVIE